MIKIPISVPTILLLFDKEIEDNSVQMLIYVLPDFLMMWVTVFSSLPWLTSSIFNKWSLYNQNPWLVGPSHLDHGVSCDCIIIAGDPSTDFSHHSVTVSHFLANDQLCSCPFLSQTYQVGPQPAPHQEPPICRLRVCPDGLTHHSSHVHLSHVGSALCGETLLHRFSQ